VISARQVEERLDQVEARIESAGGGPDVSIVAVTKGFGVDAIEAAMAVGLIDLGENYAQELLDKVHAPELVGPVVPRIHFIGRLQRNKVRALADVVTLWQSVDRLDLATEIARRAPGATVLVQLNLSGEATKGGCDPAGTRDLVDGARALGLDVQGLMGVGPAGPPAAAEAGFRRLVELADSLDLPIRSIGMSADLEVAVAAGSTMVRVGTDLFGPRPPHSPGSLATDP
jgi:PLP dependent protein